MQIEPQVIEETLDVLETVLTSITMSREDMSKTLPLYRKLVTILAQNTSHVISRSFAGVAFSDSLLEEVKELLAQRMKIQAIKRVRDVTGQDLRTGNTAVETIQDIFHLNY